MISPLQKVNFRASKCLFERAGKTIPRPWVDVLDAMAGFIARKSDLLVKFADAGERKPSRYSASSSLRCFTEGSSSFKR